MTIINFAMILTAVVMSASAQLTLKLGMSSAIVKAAIASGEAPSIVLAIATSPFVVGGLAIYGLSVVVWLFVLAKLDLSLAYPFVGMGFIVTMLLAAFVLGEHITLTRVLGTLLIVVGCALVARTA